MELCTFSRRSSFKTTTVGLRLTTTETLPFAGLCFKTTTVGLRHILPRRTRQVRKGFQNHYGWIETGLLRAVEAGKTLFQNHYGWIETEGAGRKQADYAGFKTTTVGLRRPFSTLVNYRGIRFKTTTVGLRRKTTSALSRQLVSFKTTTVGLRRLRFHPNLQHGQVFQNHYGWIETSQSLAENLCMHPVSKPLRLD